MSSAVQQTPIHLSPRQARKLVLLSQGIYKDAKLGKGKNAALKAIEKLGYIQIDTISVVERAHHHTLWNRVNGYQNKFLNKLQEDKKVFEYWSHAAAYLPMRDFRFSLPRKHAIASGEKHWYEVEEKLMSSVLDRVRIDGPLQSKDFEHTRKGEAGWWEWKPAKRALEQLFMRGDLMIAKRQGFQKVYDLPERVLPSSTNTTMPSKEEFYNHLVNSYLAANGVGKPQQIGYLRKGLAAELQIHCQNMVEDGRLLEVAIQKQAYYAPVDFEQTMSQSLSRNKVRILSPFDNLLIQRKRTKDLFNFDYLIECYVPAAKRKFGYFCLPILWGHQFAGRMDAKIERKTGLLRILNLYVETPKSEEFLVALMKELDAFLDFNKGKELKIEQISHR